MKFDKPAAHFKAARSYLMLPHQKGETASIAQAFIECSFGVDNVQSEDLDDYARGLLEKVKQLMDSAGLKDPASRGLHSIKAEKLTIEQRRELSSVVDELATWFDIKSRMDASSDSALPGELN